MTIELNEFEAKLLYLLDINCRESTVKLAKKLRTSPQRIEYTIDKLEKEGVIIGYVTVIDYSKLGPYTYHIYGIKLYPMNEKTKKEKFEKISKNSKCTFFFELEGKWDILIGTMGKNLYEVEDNLNEILGEIKEKIYSKELFIVTRIQNQYRNYLIESINKEDIENLIEKKSKSILDISGLKKHKEKYDEIDERIIRVLSNNAKIKIIDIAKKIQLKPETVWHRIKKLEKNKIIVSYDIYLQPNNYNYLFYLIEIKIIHSKKEFKNEVCSFLKRHHTVYRIIEILGDDILFVFIVCKNEEQKNKMISNLENVFELKIETITINKISKTYMFRYFLGI